MMRDSGMGSFLRTTYRLLGYRHRQEQWPPSLYCERLDAKLDYYLVHLFQDREFFQSRPLTSHFHATNVRHDLETPSPVLLVPPAFSPYLDSNGGIDLLEIGSSECLTLRLPWTNKMWKGGSKELQVIKGY